MDSLSERSRYLRFMYVLGKISDTMVERFTRIDEASEAALVAIAETDSGNRQIGVARFSSLDDGRVCEFAIVISDDWQGNGIATGLLTQLIETARERGLEVMEGQVLRENGDMLSLARKLGFRSEISSDDPQQVIVRLALQTAFRPRIDRGE